MNHFAYEFIRVGYFGGCRRKCTSLDLLNRTISSMMIVIAVVMNAVPEFELCAVGAGFYASCSLLSAITDATVLDFKNEVKTRHEKAIVLQSTFTHRCR
jgi:hypothetical protein